MSYRALKDFNVERDFEGAHVNGVPYLTGATGISAVALFPFVVDLLEQVAIEPEAGTFRLSLFEALSGARDGSNPLFYSVRRRAPGTAALLVCAGLALDVSDWSGGYDGSWLLGSGAPKPTLAEEGPFAFFQYELDPAPSLSLAIAEVMGGTKDGVNTTFTSAHAPYGGRGMAVIAGVPQVIAASGTNWTLPFAPDSGDPQPWCFYPWADGAALALDLIVEVPARSGSTVTLSRIPYNDAVLLKVNQLVSPSDYSFTGATGTLGGGFPSADAADALLAIYQEAP